MWRPILEGDAARAAREAIAAIAADLPDAPARPEPAGRASLGGGDAGVALFYAYLGDRRFDAIMAGCLERATRALEATPLPVGLYAGFSGIAWVVQHLSDRFLDDGTPGEDLNEEIDQAIRTHLADLRPPIDYDLIRGLAGLGLYSLERLPRAGGAQCLHDVIGQLGKAAEPRADGITWWTHPSLCGVTRSPVPNGYYNLGVAHGVPGIIGLLGDACAAGVAAREAMPLLEGAVTWVLGQRLNGNGRSLFPYHVGPGLEPSSTRLAWCYGDLGIAVTLLAAARAVAREDWEREAIEVAHRAAAWPIVGSGVVDAGICHGAAGVAHLFNRIYQATGDRVLREAALFWYDHALSLRKPGEWVGGFYAWEPVEGTQLGQVASPGFLTGAAGVGLCLLAATGEVEPAWDRLLAARIPQGREA
jgi:lantibiotic modifying enzyme